MLCLSVRQPWATLIVLGAKLVENRSWNTDHRGTLAIHASSAAPDLRTLEGMTPTFRQLFHIPTLDAKTLPRGVVLGTVELTDCVRFEQLPKRLWDHPFAQPGCWCWVLANPQPFDVPILARGRLRLWNWQP